MTDMFSPRERSRIMSKIRSRGNAATELRFIEILKKYKLAGWQRGVNLAGQPDFVFLSKKVVVFIDGDFWHGNPRNFRLPKSNISYWEEKILSNQRRDRRISRRLRAQGWGVYRFWQSSLQNETAVVARLQRGFSRIRRDSRSRRHQTRRTAIRPGA